MRKVAALQIAAIRLAEGKVKEAGPLLSTLLAVMGAGARGYGRAVERGSGLVNVAKALGAKNKLQTPVVGAVNRILK